MTHVADLTIAAGTASATHTNFPKLIRLADLDGVGSFWSTVQNGGGDIRTFEDGGVTELPREVVSCDTATNEGEVWTLIDIVSLLSDTVVEIHADGSSSDYLDTDTYGRNAVWADYNLSIRLNDTTSFVDSSGNQTNGTYKLGSSSNLSTATVGEFGGLAFDGDVIIEFTTSAMNTSEYSLTLWGGIGAQNNGLVGGINGEQGSAGNSLRLDNAGTEAGQPSARYVDAGAWDMETGLTGSGVWYTDNDPFFIALTISAADDAGYLAVYGDGGLQGADSVTNTAAAEGNTEEFILGASHGTANRLTGSIASARQHTLKRSTDWLDDEYADQSGNAAWHTITAAGGGGSTVEAALSGGLSMGYQAAKEASLNAGFTGALSIAMATEASAQAEASLSFALSVSDAVSALVTAEAAFTVSQALSDSTAGQTQAGGEIEGSVTFSANLAGLATADAAALATISSGIEAAGNMTAIVAIPSALSAGVEAGTTVASFVGIGSNISAGILAGAQAAGEAQAYAAISVDQSLGANLIAEAMAEAGLSVSSVQNVTFVGASISGDAVTPDGRRFKVALDLRTFEVSLETRSFKADQE